MSLIFVSVGRISIFDMILKSLYLCVWLFPDALRWEYKFFWGFSLRITVFCFIIRSSGCLWLLYSVCAFLCKCIIVFASNLLCWNFCMHLFYFFPRAFRSCTFVRFRLAFRCFSLYRYVEISIWNEFMVWRCLSFCRWAVI